MKILQTTNPIKANIKIQVANLIQQISKYPQEESIISLIYYYSKNDAIDKV
jgi:hypothetical protein